VSSDRRHLPTVEASRVCLAASGVLLALWPVLAPVLHAFGAHGMAAAVDAPWHHLCHRVPARTLSVLGAPMSVCSRCLGLVVGLGVGLAVGRPVWLVRSARALALTVVAGLAVMAAEWASQEAGWHDVFHPTRLLSGLVLAYPIGAAAGALGNRHR